MQKFSRVVRISGAAMLCGALLVAGSAVGLAEAQTGTRRTQPAAAGGTFDLLAKFDRQQAVVYEVELVTEQRMDLGQVTQEYTATYKSRVAITLERSTATMTTVKLNHQRVAVSFEGRGGGPGVPMGAYDSDNPDAPGTTEEYRAIVSPMVGKSVTIEMTAGGEFVAVHGLDALAPEGIAGAIFKELFTEQTFRDMYSWLFALKTDPSTAEHGESWMVVQSANNPLGTLRRMYDLTLERASDDGHNAFINITGNLELQGSVPGMFEIKPASGSPMVVGKAEWDNQKRQVVSLESHSQTDISSTTPGMAVKMKVNAKTKLKRVDAEKK